jgi:hypothetical protein
MFCSAAVTAEMVSFRRRHSCHIFASVSNLATAAAAVCLLLIVAVPGPVKTEDTSEKGSANSFIKYQYQPYVHFTTDIHVTVCK